MKNILIKELLAIEEELRYTTNEKAKRILNKRKNKINKLLKEME